jgi:hypothetical protein
LHRGLVFACAAAALALPATANARGTMFVGAVENAPLVATATEAKAKVDLAKLAGFDTLRVAVFWARGRGSVIPEPDLLRLENAAVAAQLSGMRLIVSVSNFNSRDTPVTEAHRVGFAVYCVALARAMPNVTDFIIGNEPNLNMFWMPQFSKGVYGYRTVKVRKKGKLVKKRVRYVKKQPQDLAAPAYEKLLATTYDFLKAENPNINVVGGAVSPRGSDNGFGARPTHSPQTFIADLGKAYRASGRSEPLMDAFAMHPYAERSSQSPLLAHPKSKSIGLGVYPKLVKTLTAAFKGTAQDGATLPIVYDEFGVQSTIPVRKTGVYSNLGTPVARDAVSEATQALYYRAALTVAFCQPNVVGMLMFHVSDEANGNAWQSGLFYADDTPKSSLAPVRTTVLAARDGSLSGCSGARAGAFLESVNLPQKGVFTTEHTAWNGDVTCSAWCTFEARLEQFPSGAPVAKLKADGAPGVVAPFAFPEQKLAAGRYRLVVHVWAYGKRGTGLVRWGDPFTVEPPPPAG